MSEVDKENLPPNVKPHTKSNTSFSATQIKSSTPTPTLSNKAPLGPASLAFPTVDPNEDRDVIASGSKTLRSKRSALFYPSAGLAANANQQPFSRSAARRESIMALGSIGYLQHLYTKQGIASRKRPMAKGAALAIGPAGEAMVTTNAEGTEDDLPEATSHVRATSKRIAEEDEEPDLALPPSPKAGTYSRPKYLDLARPLEADTHALQMLLVSDLRKLSQAWGLSTWITSDPSASFLSKLLAEVEAPSDSSDNVDLLSLIDITTKAIRSARSYILALPQRSKIPMTSPNEPNGRDRYKRQSSFSGVSRPGQIGTPVLTRTSEILHHDLTAEDAKGRESLLPGSSVKGRQSSSMRAPEDLENLSILRKAALEMLSALKDMEQRNRVETLYVNNEEIDQDTSTLSGQLVLTSSDPDESSINSFANASSSAGYLYRSDLKLSELAAEREILQSYLKTVNTVLSVSATSTQDARRRSSSESVSEVGSLAATEAAPWTADRTPCIRLHAAGGFNSPDRAKSWTATGLTAAERVSLFMIDHCEACTVTDLNKERVDRMRDAKGDLERLLSLLYDGYLLCRALNETVRRSDKPWGYISSREMHDLEAEEAALLHKEAMRLREAEDADALNFQTRANRKEVSEGGSTGSEAEPRVKQSEEDATFSRPGWTFRRTENLRVWATALKLRYHIQTTATKATPAKQTSTGPTYGSLGMGKLALHGRRAASESYTLSSSTNHRSSRTMDFDPVKVARKEPGWQDMLTKLLTAWIDAVVEEQGRCSSSSS
ncbi:uncharacterized protein MEPE_01146 [Melanopsichium pennsylvanicum]|uniref:Uncharacterized protein n=2 Tax=Melanopsichium pennsylvanicum TaxID=63383 RepID=A0AAJ5C3B6_9BASI|nr:conserved hypothetical protein [Melanopsichium pennsylvanicum 4]SNX82440.1 uncharacterized protein MEPE_01146 [Melanopsichium pennsylvanicum]